MVDNPTTLVECQDWRRSHADTPRWRAYYVAFEIKHGRPSGDHEFDPQVSQMVSAVVNVLRSAQQDMWQ